MHLSFVKQGQSVVPGTSANIALTTTFGTNGGVKRRAQRAAVSKAIPLNPPSQAKGEDKHAPFACEGGRRAAAGGCRWHAGGFTLLELMLTLAVAAVLLVIAVPSFKHLMLSNRLTTTANAMVHTLNQARMDAIKLNATTQFCGSDTTGKANTTNNDGSGADTLGAACAAGDPTAVYALPQDAAAATQVRAGSTGLASSIQTTTAGVAAVRFSGQGFGYLATGSADTPYAGTIAVICTSRLDSNNQRKVSMTSGSIIAVATSSGACP